MNELTAAERIAVGLFGWVRNDSRTTFPTFQRGYSQTDSNGSWRMACIEIKDQQELWGDRQWPEFDDERLCWYWVERMQQALAERGWLARYCNYLLKSSPDEWDYEYQIRASAAQRVAAALRVIEEGQ